MKLTRRDFAAGIGCRYYRTLHHRQRCPRPGRDHQDRHVRAGNGSRRRSRGSGPERRQAGAGGRQQGRRRARQAGRTGHRRRPDHQSRHRAGVLQARRPIRHRRLPRFDPLDPGACDGARRPQARQARDDRRHRSQPDPYGQSVAVPLPPQRQLFRPRDRRLRRQDARQEEMGDRCIRPTRSAPPAARRWRRRSKSSARRPCSIRAMPTRARISRRSCWR